ncbi:Putative plasmid stability protein y4jJ (fragment) [Candidatus Methylobacter favarea]|uniref:Plasmid stability protein y4jJ n=1 Tax=Candidatus Methylobacter favarea TaxID=2707345 RepID=A0A8S0X814_9GAMM
MATLTIRNLPDLIQSALRVLSAQGRLNVEAEVRNILTAYA